MIAFKGIRMRNWTRINVIRARDERETFVGNSSPRDRNLKN